LFLELGILFVFSFPIKVKYVYIKNIIFILFYVLLPRLSIFFIIFENSININIYII